VTRGNKPYLYELPQDAEEVAVLAGGVAFHTATFDHPHKRSNDNLVSIARNRIDLLLKHGNPPSGMKLTNDQEEFNAFFEDCLVQVYHIVMAAYTEDPSEAQKVKGVLSKLQPQQAIAYCQAVAKGNLQAVGVRTND